MHPSAGNYPVLNWIIGASVSEPHTSSELNWDFSYIIIIIIIIFWRMSFRIFSTL